MDKSINQPTNQPTNRLIHTVKNGRNYLSILFIRALTYLRKLAVVGHSHLLDMYIKCFEDLWSVGLLQPL